MPHSSFIDASAEQRLAALFAPAAGLALPSASTLRLMAGVVAGRPVLAVATDPGAEKGVFGIAECAALRAAIRQARDQRRALVLLLDSAGARLYDGVAIQGALRALMRDLLDATLDGLPVIALLGRNVFGGASMLALAAAQRCYAPATLLAMSGPRILQAGDGYADVAGAIDGAARCRFGGAEKLLDDSLQAYADALHQWLRILDTSSTGADPGTALLEERRALEERLRAQPPAPAASLAIERGAGFISCREHAMVGAADALRLAALSDAAGAGALELRLDCSGHSVQLGDEAVLLSQYLVHLAKTLRLRVRAGLPLHLRIGGAISGGLYIATAGPASSVAIGPGGSVRALPPSALVHILKRAPDAAADAVNYTDCGVADTIFSTPDPDFAMNANLFATFETIALLAGDAPLLEDAAGPCLSYAQMLALTARYANALARLGVRPGERVAAQVDKSAQNFCLYLAALRMGAIYLPLNTAYQAGELQYFLEDAEPRVFVCAPAGHAAKGALAARCGVGHTLTLDEGGGGTLAELAARESEYFATAPMAPQDVAIIIYTSGTTGRPKGAMLTHANLLSNARALTALWGFTERDVLLHTLPLFHAHGLFISSHCALLSGSRMLFLKKFNAAQVVGLLPRASVMVGVPTFYTRLLDLPAFDAACAAHVRVFISGSAPLLAETSRAFLARTGQVVLERYGMTESAIISSNPCAGERRIGSVGQAIPGVEVRIADAADQALPAGAVGGIQIRGSGVMKGYWRQPQLTAAEFSADGWFRTGDLGTLGADGYLSIVGRAKDMLISGGYNVYPKEIEMAIDALPGVLESAVIGVPDRDFGEAVTAVVVCRGAALDASAVIAPLKSRLANYKVPKHVHFVAELPRNAMGKVLKNVLRSTYGGDKTV